jgi:hypothetical protein
MGGSKPTKAIRRRSRKKWVPFFGGPTGVLFSSKLSKERSKARAQTRVASAARPRRLQSLLKGLRKAGMPEE